MTELIRDGALVGAALCVIAIMVLVGIDFARRFTKDAKNMTREELINAMRRNGTHHCVLLASLTNACMVAMLEEFKKRGIENGRN